MKKNLFVKLWFKILMLVLIGICTIFSVPNLMNVYRGVSEDADSFYSVDTYLEYSLENEPIDIMQQFAKTVLNQYFNSNCDMDLTKMQLNSDDLEYYFLISISDYADGTYNEEEFKLVEVFTYREYFSEMQYAKLVSAIENPEEYGFESEITDEILMTLEIKIYSKVNVLDSVTYFETYDKIVGKYSNIYNSYYDGLFAIIILSGLIVLFLVLFLVGVCKKETCEGVFLKKLSIVPIEIPFIIFASCLENTRMKSIEWIFYERNFSDTINRIDFKVVAFLFIFTIISLVYFSYSLAVVIKAKRFHSNSFIVRVFYFFKKLIQTKVIKIDILIKTVIFVCLVFLIQWTISKILGDFVLIFFNIFVMLPCVCMVVIYFKKIIMSIKEISIGNYEYKINTKYMYSEFKETAETLNNISDGMNNAVFEKIKSERLKTELITNLTHDIKTPLTSIINYVDLIGKEKVENERIRNYTEVLNRQSNKLKRLITNLMDISKITTGNIETSLVPMNIGMMMEQIYGEYCERLEEVGLELVIEYPKCEYLILADNQHLHRIFDNLIGNIIKYSIPNTRVYFTAQEKDGLMCITLKNLSKEKLNINASELVERFVRGDGSRNTEGNGLGLSIVENLMKAQDAEIEIVIDGDLFKVILEFEIQDNGKI